MEHVEWCGRAAAVLRGAGRDDLADRVEGALARLRRTDAVVCVVGEFKQGKSSLVNALLGDPVCPVDDDLATAVVTLVHHGDAPHAVVHRRIDGERSSEAMTPAAAVACVVEPRQGAIERVDLALPNPVLAGGLAIVDMPGWGGLDGGAAAAALAFVALADAVLFVSDAAAELSAPELELLGQARERCGTVVVCVTKTDLHPEWRRIAELDRSHLAAAGIDVPVIPVSASLQTASRSLGDEELAARSGIPALEALLLGSVVPGARQAVAGDAVEVGSAALGSHLAVRQAELVALASSGEAELTAAVAASCTRLDQLRAVSGRWPTTLTEGMAQLTNEVGFAFRAALRDLGKLVDEEVEAAGTAEAWDAVGRRVQREVTVTVERAFAQLTEGADALAAELSTLTGLPLHRPPGSAAPAVELPSPAAAPEPTRGRRAAGVGLQAFDALRGASGGVIVVSLLATTLPAATTAILLSNPFTIGLGLFAGGRTLLDGRSRRLAQHRSQARAALRQFLDDVQFAVGNELAGMARTVQLELRQRVATAIEEVQRDASELADAAARAAEGERGREARRAVLIQEVAEVERLLGERPAP